MSGFEVITVEQKEKWNGIVRSFGHYEVFYLNEYVEAFQELRNDKGLLLWYENNGTRAMNVVFKRDVAGVKQLAGKIEPEQYFDLQTPYGYGGMLIEGNGTAEVWKAYEQVCREQNIVCEFVRFSLFSNGAAYYNGTAEARTHNIVRNLEIPMEEIFADFEYKVRKNLKKAQRNGLEAILDQHGTYFEDFLRIYYDTMDRNQAKEEYYFPRSFFEKFLNMKENAAWFYIRKEEQIISAELVIYNENNCYSFLGGTVPEFFEFRPNELLKVEIMKWAQEKKIKNFVLGGGYGGDDGIFRYKKSFAPNGVMDFYIGTKIWNKEIYDRLTALRTEDGSLDADTKYFPKYRG